MLNEILANKTNSILRGLYTTSKWDYPRNAWWFNISKSINATHHINSKKEKKKTHMIISIDAK